MKRFTIEFSLLDQAITPEVLKAEVERILLCLHPRTTYLIGHMTRTEQGKIWCEFEADGAREMLEAALLNMDYKLPIKAEKLYCGWLENDNEILPSVILTSSKSSNPLANEQPVKGDWEVKLSTRKLWARCFTAVLLSLVMIVLLVANVINNEPPLLQWLYVIGFLAWMIVINEMPYNIFIYAERMTFLADTLVIKYWWQRMPVQLYWVALSGLDYSDPTCKLYVENRKYSFIMSKRFGSEQQEKILKTITTRAGLYFVEGRFQKLVYRKP
jgi:hypothetical protein